jgi:hypothetical protein
MKCCRGGLRRGRRIRDRGRRVGRDGVASETRCRRTHSRLRTSSASSHDSSPPRATVERRVGEWTMRASTRLASPTPARFAPGEEATRGRATAHEACTAEALIVMSGVEARRARACGEHCRVPFRRCQKSPLAAVARARSGSRSTSFVSPVRSFADPVNVPNLAEQSVWKYSKSPLKKASVSEGGRRPDAWCRSARAHARLDTRTARFSRKVRRSYTRVGFQWTPTPISVAAVDAARVPPIPARFASSRRTLSLRVLLSFQADRSIGALLRGWPPGRRPPPSRSTSSDDLPPDARPNRV